MIKRISLDFFVLLLAAAVPPWRKTGRPRP